MTDCIEIISMLDDTEFKEDIKRLAKRLGVSPSTGNEFGYMLSAGSGENYSVMKMCHAFLNRMDAAAESYDKLREAAALCIGNAVQVNFEGQPRISIRRDLFDELLGAFNEVRSAQELRDADEIPEASDIKET